MKVRIRRKGTDLRIYYDGFDFDFDTVLIKILRSVGWHLWATGFDHRSSERELAFDYVPQT